VCGLGRASAAPHFSKNDYVDEAGYRTLVLNSKSTIKWLKR
jgi:hypothetical protein